MCCRRLEENIKIQVENNNNIDKYEKLQQNQKALEEQKDYIESQKQFYEKNQKILLGYE